MNTIFFVAALASFLVFWVAGCESNTWTDCGAPLSRTITYTDVTLSPEAASSEGLLSIHITATTVQTIQDAETYVSVTKDGLPYFNTSTRNLCNILSYSSITCPVPKGTLSFNYVFPLPGLPQGNYTIKVTNSINHIVIGCVSATLIAVDPTQASGDCTYTSWGSFNLGAIVLQAETHENGSKLIGDWVQIGPAGTSAGSLASAFPWGHIVSYQGTTDIIAPALDLSNFVWGLTGNLTEIGLETSIRTIYNYTGTFFLGYPTYAGAPLSETLTVATGTFKLIIDNEKGRQPREEIFAPGSYINILPQDSHPKGFFYPLMLGQLNPYTLTQGQNGVINVQGSKTWCTCPLDNCGVCGGDNATCDPGFVLKHQSESEDLLDPYEKGALAVGLVGGLIAVALITFFVYQHWKHGREARYARNDSDLTGPEKPDYGSMAINDVLADHERP